jgi:hypothetical protein
MYQFIFFNAAQRIALTLCLITLTACGGGGGSDSEEEENPGGVNIATLRFDTVTMREDLSCLTDIGGYAIYAGAMSGNYTREDFVSIDDLSCVPSGQSNACGAIQTCFHTPAINLAEDTWYFVVAAYDSIGVIGEFSNELSLTVD